MNTYIVILLKNILSITYLLNNVSYNWIISIIDIFVCWSKLSSYRLYILWVGPKYYLKHEMWFVRSQNDDGQVIINFKETKAIKSSSIEL